jgi:proteasome lid subunit RPN8/RPN11
LPGPDRAPCIRLAPGIAAAIHAAARAAAPRECCGLLEGARSGEDWRVSAIHPARNLAAGADRFEIDPADHFAAARAARAAGRAIIGCYHSHPGGRAVPSARDLSGAGQQDFLWLIAAAPGGKPALAAFLYRDGAFCALAMGAEWTASPEQDLGSPCRGSTL